MGWTNLATIQAQLDPGYQSKMRFLQEKLTGEAQLAQFQAQQSANLEQQRHYNNHDLERARAGNQADADARRFASERDADGRRFAHDRDMQRNGHYLKLQEMQADLNKSLTLASLEYQASMLKTVDDAHVSVVDTISTMLLQQDAVMGEVVKMYAAARFGEAKSRADHIRQLETMRTQQELNIGEKVYLMLNETVAKFMEAGKDDDAKAAIDKACADTIAAAF